MSQTPEPDEGVRGYTGDNGYTYGPDFEVIAAQTFRINPSRSDTRCPICGGPVDVRGRHAVIEERFEGVLVGGCYAHADCCSTADNQPSDKPSSL